jgi:hypothetical protein
MSRKYVIDYVVMKKENIKKHLFLPIVYENDFFVIYKFSVDSLPTLDEAESADRTQVK